MLVDGLNLPGPPLSPKGSLPAAARFACGPISLGIAAWGVGGVSRQPTSVCELCWSLRFSIKAPMLIFREALDIFAHRCFAYLSLAKYAILF